MALPSRIPPTPRKVQPKAARAWPFRAEAVAAKRLWEEAGRKGLKGDARYDYVRERMGRDQRADRGGLWRMLRKS